MIDKNTFDGSLMTKGHFFRKARMDANQDSIIRSVRKYIDSATNMIFSHMTRERRCLVCGSAQKRQLFYKNSFSHVQCSECKFVYVDPVLKDDILNLYYHEEANSWTEITMSQEYKTFQDRYSHFHIDNIEGCIKSLNKTILDIGCNNGEFLQVARARGWNVCGYEVNAMAVKACRQKGIEIIDRGLSVELFNGRKFGAVAYIGVLEHLSEPAQTLDLTSKLLEDGGVLATVVPNIDSLATRVLQEKCNTFDGIEHINFWNCNTFELFLKKAGFKILRCETAISELYTLNNFLYFENPYACPDEHPFLVDTLTPEYIHKNFLGHHLVCYSMKT